MTIAATKARCDADRLWVELADGRVVGVPLAWFPRLLRATPAERDAVEIGAFGLHWEALDEDISIAGLLRAKPLSQTEAGRCASPAPQAER